MDENNSPDEILDEGTPELTESEVVQQKIAEMEETIKSTQSRFEEKENELAFYRNLHQSQPVQQTQELPEEDLDDWLTKGQVLDVVQKAIQKQSEEQKSFKNFISASLARQAHSDYDEVIKYAEEKIRVDPSLAQAVLDSVDPAGTLYQLGQTHPEVIKKAIQEKSKATAEKIKTNLDTPGTITDMGGGHGSVLDEVDAIWEKNDDEFGKYINNVKYGAKR